MFPGISFFRLCLGLLCFLFLPALPTTCILSQFVQCSTRLLRSWLDLFVIGSYQGSEFYDSFVLNVTPCSFVRRTNYALPYHKMLYIFLFHLTPIFSLLYNGYRVIPGFKASGSCRRPSTPSSTEVNPLKTKRRPLYLKAQLVPRCKHFSTRL
jgi:hypothetical protein